MSRKTRPLRRATAGATEPVVDINTTPLIDVMLVLLVMLIITIPIQLHQVPLNLPVGQPPAPSTPPEVVRVDIDTASRISWNGSGLADVAELRERLSQAAAQSVQPEVHVRPQPGASYDRFAAVMTAINQAGLAKLGVIGSEQFLEE
jgi:biopolymer transport protein ExbD